jgi:L-galactose dehydrogenase
MSIPTRPLGNTGIQVPVLGFGAATLGGAYGPVAMGEAGRAVQAAIGLGMGFFDTSPYYGGTESERVLGRCLAGIARDRYVLASKVGRYGERTFDFTAERVVASVDESLARLGTDHLDLLQCHDIEFWPLQRIIDETLPALQRLKRAGKVRAIGITGYPLKIFRTVLASVPLDVVLSYCHYTLLDDGLAAEARWLGRQGVGVLNASPLAMGLLSSKGPPPWHPADEAMRAACRRAAAHCAARGTDLGRVALQFALTLPGVASTFVGIGGESELTANLAAVGMPPDGELLAELRTILAPVHNQRWTSGLTENN